MIAVVCVGIENQGNLGAIARVMANFGVEDLVLINPVCAIEKEALDRASHAKGILKKSKKAETLDILKEYDYVIGTTSILGTDYNLPRSPLTPEELVGIIDPQKKIALLLGRESSGLSNKELESCDFTVTIPSSKEYPVLNISHACAVILYELSKKSLPQKKKLGANITAISGIEKNQILKQVDDILSSMQFITEKRKKTQQTLWKRIVGKSFLTKREAYALMGFLKKFKLK